MFDVQKNVKRVNVKPEKNIVKFLKYFGNISVRKISRNFTSLLVGQELLDTST